MNMLKVRIEGDGFRPSTRVYIDDIDISSMVIGITVNIGVDKAPTVCLETIAPVFFDGELKAELSLLFPDLDFDND